MNLSKYITDYREKNWEASADSWNSPPLTPLITCKDGFYLSVQASSLHYSCPRKNIASRYVEVEVGFPSLKPEFIMSYAEEPENPTETVYGYVPIELVEQLIEFHGGMKE